MRERRECTDVFVTTEAEEVIHHLCLAARPGPDAEHHHHWQEFLREPRCPTVMNDYRCDLWANHGQGCHSKALMYAIAGERMPDGAQ